MAIKTLSVNCPTCKKEVLMTAASPFRPFCSARCRDVDFGGWASESFVISETFDNGEEEDWSEDTRGEARPE